MDSFYKMMVTIIILYSLLMGVLCFVILTILHNFGMI